MDMKDMMEIFEGQAFLEGSRKRFVKFSDVTFESVICMMVEEWAKENKKDCVEIIDEISQAVHMVNEELGKY